MRKTFSQVIFDFDKERFWYKLAPIQDSITQITLLKEIYFETGQDSITVNYIATESTWFKQGLRADDFIIAVNGKPVTYWLQNLEEFRKTDYESFEFVDNGVRRTIYK